MPCWTDLDTVKKHLQTITVPNANVENERHVLSGVVDSQMQFTNVDTGTEEVKICQIVAPYQDALSPITLTGTVEVNLTFPEIVWESVVVASDQHLTTVFAENFDYIIDYDAGTIKRTDTGSSIPSGSTVYVWYLYFHVFTKNVDYLIDYSAGQIRRIATGSGGTIPDGATVFIDYSHSQTTPADDLISQAITEAESWMLCRLDPNYSCTSSDQGLTDAATFFALAIINLGESQRMLALNLEESSAISNRHHELATRYNAMGLSSFQCFSRALALEFGGIIQNRNSGPGYDRNLQSPTVNPRYRRK